MTVNADRRLLTFYMALMPVLAAPVVLLTAVHAHRADAARLGGSQGVMILLLSLILIAGEMWPIPVARGEDSGDEITVSSTFGLALLLVAPVFYVILAQTLALLIDWRVGRRVWNRVPFNIAQYALAFIAARAVYASVAGYPFAFSVDEGAPNLLASVAAGVAFLVVNNGLVGIAVAIRLRANLWTVLTDDLGWQLMTSVPLLGLGPLAAHASLWTPWSILLVLVPVIALYFSGRTAMKREQEALRDPLTGLANRTMLATAAGRALRSSGDVAMMLIDLDHFKDVNDTLGHGIGDQLLQAVADRLNDSVAATDLVARLGGDEFVVLVRQVHDYEAVVALALRLQAAISSPYSVQSVTLRVGCSVGIALAPLHTNTVEGLLRCADVALYAAKVDRGTHAVYNRHTDQHSTALLGLQADLRATLEDPDSTQIHVLYQPQVRLDTGQVSAVECLVRWQHPELGLLLPDNFIPMAESTGLIEMLTRRVLHQALAQLVRWDQQELTLSIAVNLSARQLSDLALPNIIAALLAQYDIAPARLVLEVTESRLMSDPERSISILHGLQATGVAISIDDFGTGYSSLAYLQRLAVDELKIDKSFTLALREPGNAMIVRSTIELGHNLGLRVVAEGVETLEAYQQLTAMGCDLLQGYLIARPSLAHDIPAVLLAWQQQPTSTTAAPGPRRPTLELLTNHQSGA